MTDRIVRNKTIPVARRDGIRKEIEYKPSWGWLLPPEDDGITDEGYVGGYKAYQDCIRQWREKGWEVQREPNRLYREPNLSSLIFLKSKRR
jgi:hypothetical protein